MTKFSASANADSHQVNVAGSNFGPINFHPRPHTKPHQLPAELRDFSGRDAEIERLTIAMEARGRGPTIVNLFGKPGVGKSALAIRVSHGLRKSFRDGALYADMSEYDLHVPNLSAQILDAFVQALDPETRSTPLAFKALAAHYRSLLHDKRYLILLDNAQRAEDVLPLLAGSDGTAVLVTSRRPLAAIPGARLEGLPLIDLETAMLLLAEISGRKWEGSDQASLAEVVVNLCGLLPLAIRIAGASLKRRPYWTLERLVNELSSEQTRLERLREADLDVRSSFLISYRGLSADEARGFRYLGLIETADFDAGTLGALAEAPLPSAERILDELVDAQLVEFGGPHRYRLHDLLRLFARDCLVADESQDGVERLMTRVQDYSTTTFVRRYGMLFAAQASAAMASWENVHRMPLSQMVRRTLKDFGSDDEEPRRITMVELMKHARAALVLGGPGSGKSTLTDQLRFDFATRVAANPAESTICIVVTLRQLSVLDRPINDQILESARRPSVLDVTASTISDLLDQGRMFVAFDGLDELNPAAQEDTLTRIAGWLADYPSARCIVTSRPVGLAIGRVSRFFNVLELEDLSTADLRTFGAAVLATRSAGGKDLLDEANELALQFQGSDVGGSPLLFGLACEIYLRYGYIPTHALDLYERSVDFLMNHWDLQRGIDRRPAADLYLRAVLDNFALASYVGYPSEALTQKQVLEIAVQTILGRGTDLEEAQHDADQILGYLRSRGSVFVEFDASTAQPTYGFVHRGFLEYFVADALCQQESNVRNLANKLTAMVERGASLNVLNLCLSMFERRSTNYRVLGEELLGGLAASRAGDKSAIGEAVLTVEAYLRDRAVRSPSPTVRRGNPEPAG